MTLRLTKFLTTPLRSFSFCFIFAISAFSAATFALQPVNSFNTSALNYLESQQGRNPDNQIVVRSGGLTARLSAESVYTKYFEESYACKGHYMRLQYTGNSGYNAPYRPYTDSNYPGSTKTDCTKGYSYDSMKFTPYPSTVVITPAGDRPARQTVAAKNFTPAQASCMRQQLSQFREALANLQYKTFLNDVEVTEVVVQVLDNSSGAMKDEDIKYGMTIYNDPVLLFKATIDSRKDCVTLSASAQIDQAAAWAQEPRISAILQNKGLARDLRESLTKLGR